MTRQVVYHINLETRHACMDLWRKKHIRLPMSTKHTSYYSANMQYAVKYLGTKVQIKLTKVQKCMYETYKQKAESVQQEIVTDKISNFKTSTVEETTVNMVILALIVVS